MENLVRQFNEHPSEQNGYAIVRNLRCMNAHYTAVLIGKFISNLYPESINIRSDTAISAYYSKQFRLSYDLYSKNLDFANLTEEEIKRIKHNRHFSTNHITNDYIHYNKELVDQITSRPTSTVPIITFTITSCKRFDLFEKTMNSFINCCIDLDRIDYWLCVDDNSSPEDKKSMQEKYPFFTFYWKNPSEKGHPQSMNIIRDSVKTPYIFHMEDDWKFFHRRNYISDCMEVLSADPSIGQCLINKNYAETIGDESIVGGLRAVTKRGIKFFIHEYTPDQTSKDAFTSKYNNNRNCAYWPHFSFRPSLLKRDVLIVLGPYNEEISHFEMEYSHKYANKGYKSCFLDGIFCLHTGRLTSQRNNKEIPNAYDLNGETQFSGKEELLKKKKRFDIPKAKTYVVNMDARADRMRTFENNTPINYERFSAVNGNLLKPNTQLQRIFEGNDYNMRAGVVGCAMSHIKMYIELVNSDLDMFCIIEDDAVFSPKFVEQLKHVLENLPENWDLVYIGHSLYPQYKTGAHSSEGLPILEKWDQQRSRQQSMGGTFGYLISKEGARKLLEFINTTGMTNGIDTVQQKAIGVIDTYYCLPHLVFSDCVLPWQKVDSDIQYNRKSLTMTTIESNPEKYRDRLKKDGVFNIDDALEIVKERHFQYTNDWFGRNINISMKILKNLFQNKPVKVLEIGTHEGRSAIWMLENLCKLSGSTFTSVDPYCIDDTTSPVNTEMYKRFVHNIKLCTEFEKFNQFIDYSYNIMPKLIEEKKVYDIIYLNGSHLTPDVFQDAMHSHQMIESGGIILFDNAGFDENKQDGIMPAIKQFLAKYPDEYKVLLKEWQWMIQKI